MPNSTHADEDSTVVAGGRWSRVNWVFIGFFGVLTLLGAAISTGILGAGIVTNPPTSDQSTVRVPVFVYLYATLGALGYIFTKLMTQLERFDEWGELEKLAEMGLRIPAAWVLAAGIYLLYTATSTPTNDLSPQLSAGIAFIVGLYVNVALKSLGSLADRILGRGSR